MCASLNAIIYNSKIIPSEYSGWAGDLVTLMGQIIKYDENKTNNELIKYGNSLIGANSTNTLFNEKDNQELIQKTLNDLKNNEAEISKETLSHYGKGMTQSKGNDQSSIRIFNYKDTYRLKFSYDSNLNLEKFI